MHRRTYERLRAEAAAIETRVLDVLQATPAFIANHWPVCGEAPRNGFTFPNTARSAVVI
jgi:hypothetical protein